MTAPITMAKRAAAGTLALAVCFTGGVLGASAAQAAPGFAFDTRFPGADRFETAVSASKAAFADGAGDVIVVQDDALADGLTASYLAGVKKAPILYVKRNEVPSVTSAELTRLNAERVYIVGGSAVVSTGVETSLRSNGRTVTRIGGTDRFDTAARVATSDSNDVGTVFIANGDAPADALAAGPIAYRSTNPILLTRPMDVPGSTTAALNRLNEENRIVLGGNAVVSTSTYSDLGATARLSGQDRQGTAVAIADYATANEDFTKANAALVGSEDRNTADALIAAPILGQTGTPILFTTRGGLGVTSTTYLTDNVDELTGEGYVFGGNAAVPQSVVDEATAAASGEGEEPAPVSQGLNITPNDAQTLVIATPDDTTDDRTYRVADLDDSLTYRVTLVNADNVNIDSAGAVTFRSSADAASASGFSVDPGTRTTVITVVNGSPVTAGTQTSTARPVGGNLSFTIDGEGAESVYPVVYVNGAAGRNADQGGPSERLETQATAAGQFAEGAERYGLGGLTTYVPIEATAGTIAAGSQITSVNKQANYVIANTPAVAAGSNPVANPAVAAGPSRTYFFDGNDQFRVNGAPVTLATFVASLSTGDAFNVGTYAADPDLQSTFDLNDITPEAVTGVTATPVDDTSIQVTWNAGTDADSYTVYRKAGTAETTTLSDYTAVATLPGSTTPLTYTDRGLTASTNYVYAVTQTVDGDESVLSDASNATTSTSAAGVSAVPNSIAAGVTTDDSFAGTVSPGDRYTIAFNRPINPPAEYADATANDPEQDGAIIRLQDANGESVDLENGLTATFTRNPTTVTYNGRAQAPNTVLTVTVGTGAAIVDRDGNATNNNNSVDYPATIVAQNGGITAPVNGRDVAWNPSTSTDNILETGATAPTAPTDVTPPTISGAAYVSATQVRLTMSEPVRGSFGANGSGDGSITPGNFTYDGDGVGATTATPVKADNAALSSDGRTITLTFPATTVATTGNTADQVVYTPAGTTTVAAGDVVDTSDNRLLKENEAVTGNDS